MLKRMLNIISQFLRPLQVRGGTPLQTAIPREDLPRLKAYLCSLAERIGQEGYGIQLDYSIDSIQRVEEILASIHDDYRRTRSMEGLDGIALEFAAYIVSVVERHFGPATWERDDPEFGKDTFPLRWRGSTLYPYSWCQKRILDGPGDNVWTKFQIFIMKKGGEK